jgi:hypothetical protein
MIISIRKKTEKESNVVLEKNANIRSPQRYELLRD